MNPIQEALASKRTRKKFLSECDFIFLTDLNEQITASLTARKAEHEALEQQKQEREVKRLELLELIKAEGFSPHDLFDATASQKQAKRKPKYQYSENGVSKVWSGVGRVPVAIQQALDAGKTLDSFLI
ncbi:H-NS family nucleoid-associated regulatory protein [Salmonella enterica]|nr:DNA-binding protein [Salmonella enterica subsp. enterica serovar Nigeria]ECG8305591.1 DNA-binding protein [Salmonella enterica subsp. enterica serovar Glostrup]ECG9331109.1 DNA-binding protein [Salmonella enterica]EEE8158211.1 H-NS histone family protein [Salmonella enterica subsp. enterica serovar Badagry]EIN7308263.1 H-NS histone family protein [Salmonella enterica subsp. enterica serovar Telelkebir]